eukprot:PhF_6_TR18042/c0_g1_i1/m.26899
MKHAISFTRCGSSITFLEPAFDLQADMTQLSVTISHSAFESFLQSFRVYRIHRGAHVRRRGRNHFVHCSSSSSESEQQYELKVEYPSDDESISVDMLEGKSYRFAVYTYVSPFTCAIVSSVGGTYHSHGCVELLNVSIFCLEKPKCIR